MEYALLIYGRPGDPAGPMSEEVATALDRPDVIGWVRLHSEEAATTLRTDGVTTLLTDGPFVESKEYLAGIITVEAEDLDAALAITRRFQDVRSGGAIEVRPVVESSPRGS